MRDDVIAVSLAVDASGSGALADDGETAPSPTLDAEPPAPPIPVLEAAVPPSPEPPPCTQRCGAAECPCPGQRVTLVSSTGETYRIDATEVTVTQYASFLDASPQPTTRDAGAQPDPTCAWNDSHTPAQTPYDIDTRCETDFDFELFLRTEPNRPVVCVDWCDARDYCRWMGGRLCGVMGGGALDETSHGTAQDEWYSACSNNGQQAYAYGEAFDAEACNVLGSGNGSVSIEVAQLPECEGPTAGLFDMTGNVDEWVDFCAPDDPRGQTEAECFRVGGAFFQPDPALSRCDAALTARRSTQGNNTGVRCCYDG